MQAGKLNKRITIQAQVTTQNAIGEQLTSWTTVCVVSASVNDMTGREFFAAGAPVESIITKIQIRHMTDITAAMRVLCADDVYNIEAVLHESNKALTLMCKRVT